MTNNRTTELKAIMDEFEHECFMLRVEWSETRAREDIIRKSYERIRDEFAERISTMLSKDSNTDDALALLNEIREANRISYDDYSRLFDAIAMLDGWKLTVEQIRKIIEEAEEELLESCEYIGDMGQRKTDVLKTFSKMEQAIAALGNRTCEQVLVDHNDGLMPPFTAHCSMCGAEWVFTSKYCHNCGAKCIGTHSERKVTD